MFREELCTSEGVIMYSQFSRTGRPHGRRSPGTALVLAALVLVVACAPLGAAPVNQSVSPESGTLPVASTVTLTVTHSDSAGAAGIRSSYLLLNGVVSGLNSVYLYYDASANQLKLRNENNTGWLQGAPGSGAVIENTRCKVFCAQTSVSSSGSTLAVNWRLELKSPMAGRSVNAYVFCEAASGKTAWDTLGTYIVGAVPAQPPANVSVTPASGPIQINTPTTITGVYSDADGAGNLAGCYLLANTTLIAKNAVYLWYDTVNDRLWARNDESTGWVGGFAPGSADTIETGLFKLYCEETAVSQSGNNLTVRWRVELKPVALGASVKAWMYALDRTAKGAGWDQKAAWSIVSDNDAPGGFEVGIPTRVPVGPRTQFWARFADKDGAADLKGVYLLINSTLTGKDGIYLWGDAAEGRIYLRNDANTVWIGGFEPGSSNIIENSRCKVYCAETEVYEVGDRLEIVYSVELKAPMADKTVSAWMYAVDWQGANSGWEKVSYFTGYWPQPPMNESISPLSGDLLSGTVTEIRTTQTDPEGAYSINGSYLLVDEALDGANACYLWYDAANYKVYLRNDQNNAWLGGYAPDSDTVIENSTVRLRCRDIEIYNEARTLTIVWAVEFKTPAAPRNVKAWLYASNWYGKTDGFDQMGSYTIRRNDASTARGRLQALISADEEVDACAEFDWFDAYRTANPGDKTAILGWSIARVACAVSEVQSKYGVSDDTMASVANFQNAVKLAASDDLPELAQLPVNFVTGHGAETLASSGASALAMQPASAEEELTPGALAADIKSQVIPAIEDAIGALDPVISDTSFAVAFTSFDGQVGNVRTEEVRMYRAALKAALALLSTAVAYSWDDTGFDWNRSPEEMDLNQDGLLAPAEYLPGGSFGTLTDATAMTTAWNALNGALDDAMAVAENDFAVDDPDQFLRSVVAVDWGAMLGVLDEADLALAGRVVVPVPYEAGPHFDETTALVTMDLSRFWLNPIADLRALAPVFALGRDYWNSQYVTVRSLPDPTMNGIFPRGARQIPLELWNEWFGSGPLEDW